MQKQHEAEGCIQEQLFEDGQAKSTWSFLHHNNRHLKQAIKIMVFLIVVMGIVLVAFIHLTIEIGKDRDLGYSVMRITPG